MFTPSRKTIFAAPAFAWRLLALVTAAFFLIANVAVQSHVHGTARGPAWQAVASLSPQKAPADDPDSDHCALCQQAALGGFVLAVTAPLFLLPLPKVWRLAAFHAVFGVPAIPLGWTGRAPPR